MNKSILFALLAFLIFNTSILMAQWEATSFGQNSWTLCQAENGNLIAANDIHPGLGGIYLSENEGVTWVETDAGYYEYASHLVRSGSLYLGGNGCNVAISHDNGVTWINSNFDTLFPGVTLQDPMYAIEYHNGKIYASVSQYGVVYTADEGLTWVLTDMNSLMGDTNPDDGGQWCYNLRSYNGKLYNVGAYGIWEYSDVEDLWARVDDRWYAFNSCIAENIFYVVYNAPGIPNGIRYTTDFQNWGAMPLPVGVETTVEFLEYYGGAFFMGHVNDAFFYTMDHGETWIEYRQNFPKFSPAPGVDRWGIPMDLIFSGESMFCGVFSPYGGVGGVYRAPVPAEVLSLDEMLERLHIVVYPNPANDIVSIQFPQGQEIQGVLRITDVMGRVIYNKSWENEGKNLIAISITTWPSGLYFYTLVCGDSKAVGKFLVK